MNRARNNLGFRTKPSIHAGLRGGGWKILLVGGEESEGEQRDKKGGVMGECILIFKYFYKIYHRIAEDCAADCNPGTGLVESIYPHQDPHFG